jgi:hypothetical protein
MSLPRRELPLLKPLLAHLLLVELERGVHAALVLDALST